MIRTQHPGKVAVHLPVINLSVVDENDVEQFPTKPFALESLLFELSAMSDNTIKCLHIIMNAYSQAHFSFLEESRHYRCILSL